MPGPSESIIINNGDFELSKLDVLSEEIWYFHKAITQTEGVLNRKLHLRDVLYYAISPVFPSTCLKRMIVVVFKLILLKYLQ